MTLPRSSISREPKKASCDLENCFAVWRWLAGTMYYPLNLKSVSRKYSFFTLTQPGAPGGSGHQAASFGVKKMAKLAKPSSINSSRARIIAQQARIGKWSGEKNRRD